MTSKYSNVYKTLKPCGIAILYLILDPKAVQQPAPFHYDDWGIPYFCILRNTIVVFCNPVNVQGSFGLLM